MIDAYIIHNNPKIEDYIKNKLNLTSDIYFHFIDEGTTKGKKEAYKIKGQFAARQTPFIGLFKKDKIFKGFYSEDSDNPIKDFIYYAKEFRS